MGKLRSMAAKSVDDVWKSMSTGRRQSVRQTEKRVAYVVDRQRRPKKLSGWFPAQMS